MNRSTPAIVATTAIAWIRGRDGAAAVASRIGCECTVRGVTTITVAQGFSSARASHGRYRRRPSAEISGSVRLQPDVTIDFDCLPHGCSRAVALCADEP